jgi:hypothetical protein
MQYKSDCAQAEAYVQCAVVRHQQGQASAAALSRHQIANIHPHVLHRLSAMQVLEAMDFYEVLGVACDNITPKTLKAARKARALAVHPDKVTTPGADLAGSRVNAAYDTLSSTQARSEYDAWLSRQS